MSLSVEFVLRQKRDGENPFSLFERLQELDPESLCFSIRKMKYWAFLETRYWFAVSMVAKSRAGMRCQICNNIKGIQVHHRTYGTHGKEHLFMNDLVVMCEYCHGIFHGHIKEVPLHVSYPEKEKAQKISVNGCKVVPHSASEIDVPDMDSFPLTQELIDKCRANGSFTNATVRAFGMTRSTMTKGWIFRLVGTTITKENYRAAQEGRFMYNTGKLK